MRSNYGLRPFLQIFALLALFVVQGCAVLDDRTPEEIVAARAIERVNFLMAGEYEEAYLYTTPGYRSTEGVGRYGTRWAGTSMWVSANIKSVKCPAIEGAEGAPTRCKVAMEVEYRFIAAGRASGINRTVLFEDWIYTGGDWFLYQKIADGV